LFVLLMIEQLFCMLAIYCILAFYGSLDGPYRTDEKCGLPVGSAYEPASREFPLTLVMLN